MAVLLTGANGNLAKALIQHSSLDFVSLNKEESGLLNEQHFSNIDVIFHAAADLHSQYKFYPTSLINSNLLLTTKLLEASKKFNIPRFIYISSSAVYGDNLNTSEDSPCFPISINGIVKLLNEKIISDFCSEHHIKYEILRIFNLYGGNDKFSIFTQIKKSLKNSHPFSLNNNGSAERDFIHVNDAAKIISYILTHGMDYTHLNVGTGCSIKISFIIDWVKKKFPNFQYVNCQTEELKYSCANIEKLSKLINVKFMPIENYLSDNFI